MRDLDRSIDELYAAPLEGFIAARDALAKQLREGGDRDAAAKVKALRKPSVPAWAVDQLARRVPDRLDELFAIGDRLREAQRAIVKGGDPDALRSATAEERKIVAALVDEAARLLEEAGHTATASYRERIGDTLLATAIDDDAREIVRRGRLDKELQRVGFGPAMPDLTVVPPADDGGTRPKRDAKAERARERARRLREEADELSERAGALAAAAEDAERVAERARRDAERARAAAEAANDKALKARDAADEAEKATRRARA